MDGTIKERIDGVLAHHKAVVFVRKGCPYCLGAKNTIRKYIGRELKKEDIAFVDLKEDFRDEVETKMAINYLKMIAGGSSSLPRVFINGKCIGSLDTTKELHSSGQLVNILSSVK